MVAPGASKAGGGAKKSGSGVMAASRLPKAALSKEQKAEIRERNFDREFDADRRNEARATQRERRRNQMREQVADRFRPNRTAASWRRNARGS